MIKYNPKNKLLLGGKMSEQGADKAGNILAIAALITGMLFGIAAVIYAAGTVF